VFRVAVMVWLAVSIPHTQRSPAAPLPYETLFYHHDGLTLETYLYTP
jgi:hypothetical protein